jgi:hypothetical protein
MTNLHNSGSEGQAQRRFAYSDYLELMAILLFVLMLGTIIFFIREVAGASTDRPSCILLNDCAMLAVAVNLYWHMNTGEGRNI